MTPAQALRKAADLVEPKGAWLQRHMACDKYGHTVSLGAGTAVCFCPVAAIRVACGGLTAAAVGAEKALSIHLGQGVESWNDDPNRTQPEVVAALRAAADKWDAEK